MRRKISVASVVFLLCSLCAYSVTYAEPGILTEAEAPVIIINDNQPAYEKQVVSDNQVAEAIFTEETASANEIDICPERILQRQADIDLLARLIETEAGSDFIPLEDKVKVGLTVLHRCDNPDFPDTVEENIYEPGQYAKPSTVASPMSLLAAEDAMYLWENGFSHQILPSEALYFNGDGRRNHFKDVRGNVYL
ncbi:MAG: hypothetical protein Q4A25_01045 [Candidatus Saccharibacteria bacterium]|nr:hypothetical protein [Candidatus Saccharibacteria bacterium]